MVSEGHQFESWPCLAALPVSVFGSSGCASSASVIILDQITCLIIAPWTPHKSLDAVSQYLMKNISLPMRISTVH